MEHLSYHELTLWRRLCDAHASVRDQLDRDLSAVAHISLSEFEVLRLLRDSQGALRMSDLAERAHASRSGLTRRVDRLERGGLVRREKVDGDRRGLQAVLTTDGVALCDQLTPRYIDSLRSSPLDRLNPQEMTSIASLLARIG